MKRIRVRDVVGSVTPGLVYVGLCLFFATHDPRWFGAAIILSVVVSLIEANRLCDRLLDPVDDVDELAHAVGVMRPGRVDELDFDLADAAGELEACFRELDADPKVRAAARRARLREHIAGMNPRTEATYRRIVHDYEPGEKR